MPVTRVQCFKLTCSAEISYYNTSQASLQIDEVHAQKVN